MNDTYTNPLCTRYASKQMQEIFSDNNKFSTFRKLWIALAEAEQELGLDISDEQIQEMKEHIYDIDYEYAKKEESILRHDVMAHIHTFGKACPKAEPIIHLGATSCYVGDNTDIIIQKEALLLIREKLVQLINSLCNFVEKYKDLDTLAYTHFQAAQPTTVGKRATLWLQDLMMDLDHLNYCLNNLKLLGCKGTTGTGASFLKLFNNDGDKVFELEKLIAKKMGFESCYSVSGQTYSRKVDYFTLSVLSGLAQSCQKFSNDFRLLSHLKEFDEPFEAGQVGSSAMAYKRNPMRSERISSLCRLVMSLELNPAMTAGYQWFERTLDDSANKRISIPEAFLAIDGVLTLYSNIINNCKVYPSVINKHLMEELPFIAAENIMMEAVKKGKDRQEIHELIRQHSLDAYKAIKEEGKDNDLIKRIENDERFGLSKQEIEDILKNGHFTGLASKQCEMYLKEVKEELKNYSAILDKKIDNSVNV